MLVKNEKIFCDAHFHYADCIEQKAFNTNTESFWGCSCAHSEQEWDLQSKKLWENTKILLSFGLHPQSAGKINIDKSLSFLENLLESGSVKIIGETGFDYFTEEYKSFKAEQERMFVEQIGLAQKYNVPVVIHCRKANDKLFQYGNELKKLPAVLFHSFMGAPSQAEALINKGINGYFSFGKQIMNNNKKVIACVQQLPLERLLCETDAPFQFLKGEEKTFTGDIEKIYSAFMNLRSESEEKIYNQLQINFRNLYSCDF